MAQKLSITTLLVGLLVATSFVGAAAFTTASVERDVKVGIEADNTAIIGLQGGNTDAARLNGDNQLVIDPESNGEPGLNQDANFTYGNDTDATTATTSYAFNVTNNDNVAHEFTLGYTQSQGSGSLEFYVSDGTNTATVTDSSPGTITLNSGETAYVVVTINSGTGTTDIQGTLSVKAN